MSLLLSLRSSKIENCGTFLEFQDHRIRASTRQNSSEAIQLSTTAASVSSDKKTKEFIKLKEIY